MKYPMSRYRSVRQGTIAVFLGGLLLAIFSGAIAGPEGPAITQAVTVTNVKVIGNAPAVAMGNLYVSESRGSCNLHNKSSTPLYVKTASMAATLQNGEATNVLCEHIPLSLDQYNSQNILKLSSPVSSSAVGVQLIFEQDTGLLSINPSN
jgi:hypothetical protein